MNTLHIINILIVEDDEAINQMISEYLENHEYQCTSAYSGSEAILRIERDTFDVVLLDLMLPGKSGEELLQEIRKLQDIPVIILSAKDTIDSKVALLQSGADDYLCKPFDLKELEVRIQVQLRKRNNNLQPVKVFRNLQLHDDYKTMEIKGKTQDLTKHEYKILELLIMHPHRAFTKKEIYEYAWEDNYYGDDKTINVHISNLRGKLSKLSDQDYIETIWGIGFKMKG